MTSLLLLHHNDITFIHRHYITHYIIMTSLSLHHNDINFITMQHAMYVYLPPEQLLALGEYEGEELAGVQLGHALSRQLWEDLGRLLEGGSHAPHSHVAARRYLEERRREEFKTKSC